MKQFNELIKLIKEYLKWNIKENQYKELKKIAYDLEDLIRPIKDLK